MYNGKLTFLCDYVSSNISVIMDSEFPENGLYYHGARAHSVSLLKIFHLLNGTVYPTFIILEESSQIRKTVVYNGTRHFAENLFVYFSPNKHGLRRLFSSRISYYFTLFQKTHFLILIAQ